MIHIVVIFQNIGSYHAARLRAAEAACVERGWRLTAIQVSDYTFQHPWGNIQSGITFPVETLIGAKNGSGLRSGWRLRAFFLLARSLLRLRPNVVFVPGWASLAAPVALCWRAIAGATAIVMSDSRRSDSVRQRWKERLKKQLLVSQFDAAIVAGAAHRAYAAELGVPVDQIVLGYDVVDNTFFRGAARRARDDRHATHLRSPAIPHRPFFLAMSRFVPKKNLIALVHAFGVYRSEVGKDAWDLAICGDGPLRSTLETEVVRLNLEGVVHMPGFIEYERLGDWYGLSSAFVHAAPREEWGLVINEACASSVPVLCSWGVGAADEMLVDWRSCIRFNPSDTAELAAALSAMSALPAEERTAIATRAAEAVSAYGPERFGQAFVRLVEMTQSSFRRGH